MLVCYELCVFEEVMQGTLIPRNICDHSDFRVQSKESLIKFYVTISIRG